MFKTLKNAWRIPELKKKLLFTLLIVVLYRLGANIPVPYVTPQLFEQANAISGGTILSFLNQLSGGALSRATLLALGVSPYITSSIVVQLLAVAFPNSLGKWSKDGDEGKKKITMLTRIITVVLALITAIGYAIFLKNGGGTGTTYLVVEPNFFHYAVIVMCYCAGAALVMWLAEKINESGIGNGISIILFANIIAGLFSTFTQLWQNVFPFGTFSSFDWIGLICSIASIIVLLGMVVLIVWMSDAERRIPIQYAKRVVGRKMYGGQNTHLPLKVNMSGVMPIIFANSIVAILPTIKEFMSPNGFTRFVDKWLDADTWPYFVAFLVLLIAFAYFYVAISFNPVEVANNIKNNGGAIPGIRSGRPTVEFIKKVLNRITLVGALLVAFIACLPLLVNNISTMLSFNNQLGYGYFTPLMFVGSSMMIMVGVALETTRELEAQMTLRNYKGFLD